MKTIEIFPIPSLKDNYIWAIIYHHTVYLIDPGEAKPVVDFLNKHQLILKGILVTHHHLDHTNGIKAIIDHIHVPVIGFDQTKIANLTHLITEEMTFTLQDLPWEITLLTIPGHTLDHVAYYIKQINALFCGDTLFAAGCGRLFEGTPKALFHSLQKLAMLPDETNIYCAHEYTLNNLKFAHLVEPHNQDILARIQIVTKKRENHLPSLPTSLGEEKKTNPFLRCDQTEVIQNVSRYIGKSLDHPLEVFTYLRQWKDYF